MTDSPRIGLRKMVDARPEVELRAKELANDLGTLLLDAVVNDDEGLACGAAVAAVALLHCDPDRSKQDAISLAESFGQLLIDEIKENWDQLLDIRLRFDAGEFA